MQAAALLHPPGWPALQLACWPALHCPAPRRAALPLWVQQSRAALHPPSGAAKRHQQGIQAANLLQQAVYPPPRWLTKESLARHSGRSLTSPVVQQNNTSKAVEYKGKVPELVKGMLDVPHGGQIIMDGRAFQGIKGELTTLAALVPPPPGLGQPRAPAQARGCAGHWSEVVWWNARQLFHQGGWRRQAILGSCSRLFMM